MLFGFFHKKLYKKINKYYSLDKVHSDKLYFDNILYTP